MPGGPAPFFDLGANYFSDSLKFSAGPAEETMVRGIRGTKELKVSADFVREGVVKIDENGHAVSTPAFIISASHASTTAILRETPAARLTRAGALPDLICISRQANSKTHGLDSKGEVHRPAVT